MTANDKATVIVCVFFGIVTIIWFIYYNIQGGSNLECYNCDRKLKFGEHKDFSIEDENGTRQNICSVCAKRLRNKTYKGKYW